MFAKQAGRLHSVLHGKYKKGVMKAAASEGNAMLHVGLFPKNNQHAHQLCRHSTWHLMVARQGPVKVWSADIEQTTNTHVPNKSEVPGSVQSADGRSA